MRRRFQVEWPTLLLVLACYALWALATTVLAFYSLPFAITATALLVAFHGSLTHEAVHGHPFRSSRLNALLLSPTLTLFIPYGRFRDTHIAHHMDADLTDPYDDPESNYFDPAVWTRLPGWIRWVLRFNNTLAGRMLIGPLVSQIAFIVSDIRAGRAGDRQVLDGWLWHIPQAGIVVLWLVLIAEMPIWAYLIAVYFGISVLKIRTYLEHRAHERMSARTVIIEDRGPLALMFLNNNLHVVHHMHPKLPWYRLWARYDEDRDGYQRRNSAYVYGSYAEIFRRHFFRAKDPVPHPLMGD